ncbi:hypothetical protein IHN32_08025 [Deinococcus sp. 14RED07]|uniref:WapI family immunity protein n=1 Tax=unclassified Deinococcus TaxID=2623546 RepID=UPI001E366F70|nr:MULTISPECIES: hypothetical protein [unclassified Deinococcus]MCD0157728.1 hypothetical protein [Deinococcus sp. 6GRE01]MCD0162303.1 hypothetical protein [Deinococcus sp. 6YEL10]MCD0175890.1 hypothetical protein [Deinococcus sp. 14RED07]
MRWSNGDFHLDLSVVGYEFPEETNCAEDSDWLLIQLRIECPAGPWTHIDPSLTVREVLWLAEWLREAARYGAVFSEWQRRFAPLTTIITFTEPNLAFELSSVPDTALPFQFRVYMSAESMPPFDLSTPHFEMGEPTEKWVDFMAAPSDLHQMADELSEALTRFPSRTPMSAPTDLKETA